MDPWKRVRVPTLPNLLADLNEPIIHRDLSWIQFNERVLAEARPLQNPSLKKLKFLAISASNLDEFFMIRFSSHVNAVKAAKGKPNEATLLRIHDFILDQVAAFNHKQAKTLKLVRRQLMAQKVFVHLGERKSRDFINRTRPIFINKILPHLEIKHSFRFQQLRELRNLQSLVLFDNRAWIDLARKIPTVFTQVSEDKQELHIYFLDDILLAHLKPLLKHEAVIFRITRDADFSVDLTEEDSESIPDLIKSGIGHRDKGRVVRLQIAGRCPETVINSARVSLGLTERQVFHAPHSLGLHGLFSAVSSLPEEIISRKGFNNLPLKAMIPKPFRSEHKAQIFECLKQRDFVLHHPYDSFDAYVNFIQAACEDPAVTSIEQTIYRTDTDSKVMGFLKTVAKKKKIKVFLELRARFDELNNLQLAEELQKYGVDVSFGFGQLKLHAKICLVTRKEQGKNVLYTHLSTGNYNAKTARTYTDLATFTANNEIGLDARHFFDAISVGKVPGTFKHLVTAPIKMHQKIQQLIQTETQAALRGEKAHIVAKVNALVDKQVIESLYKASLAGVKIDLIIRGACSLIPGVRGLSENIRVISIVDRFLEHSRIYYFANSKAIYLSSADWMPRNFFSRLEIAFPVLDPRIYRYLTETILPTYLADSVKAKELSPSGLWKPNRPLKNQPPTHAQLFFETLAKTQYKGTSLYEDLNFSSPRPPRQT